MSKLLFDEYPLLVLPRLAVLIGLNETIVLQQIHYWLVTYQQSKSTSHYRDGHWWVYNSLKNWRKTFPFWSKSTIGSALQSLRHPFSLDDKRPKKEDLRVERGALLLTTSKYNKLSFDRTLWYTIIYDEVDRIEQIIQTI